MKALIEKIGLWIIVAALVALLVIPFILGYQAGKRAVDTSLVPVSALSSLQDSLKTVRADLKASGDMIATLRGDSTAKGGKIRLQAATIADMTAKLAKLSGGGPGKPVDDTWSVYQDKAITAFYRQRPDTLTYQLEPRALQISLVEGLDNTWSAYAWDVMAGCPAVIDTLDIQRNREWAPPRPWYKKIGTILKYTGVAAAAGGTGYLIGRM